MKIDQGQGSSQAGQIVWSPDASALMLTVASQPCTGRFAATTSIVRVDAATLRSTTLIREDDRLFITVEWPSANQVSLQDKDGQHWWMDTATGHVATPASTAVPTPNN